MLRERVEADMEAEAFDAVGAGRVVGAELGQRELVVADAAEGGVVLAAWAAALAGVSAGDAGHAHRVGLGAGAAHRSWSSRARRSWVWRVRARRSRRSGWGPAA